MAAAASMSASLILLATPFLIPDLTAVRVVTIVNWCLFIVASYFALLPVPKWGTFSTADRSRLNVWLAVFLTFMLAAWGAAVLTE